MSIRNCPFGRSLLTVAVLLACVPSHADATGTWTRLPDLPTARLAAGAAAFDGKLYVIGGCIVRDGAVHPIAAVEVFSPATGTWETRAPLPTPRSNFGIAIADGRIFVVGGTPTDSRSQTDVVEAYDPATNTWRACAPLPTARSQVGAANVDGKIYAIGGNAGHEHAFEVYDPATDRWSSLPPLKNPRRDTGVVALGGKLYVAGGVGSDHWKPSGALEVYDPAVERWSAREPAQIGRTDFALVTLNSTIFAVGGWNHGPIASVERYDPADGTWTTGDDLPVATQFHCAAVLNGKIYLAGGTNKLPTATAAAYVWEPAPAVASAHVLVHSSEAQRNARFRRSLVARE